MMAEEADDDAVLPLTFDQDSCLKKHFEKDDINFEPKLCLAPQEKTEAKANSDLIGQGQQCHQEGSSSTPKPFVARRSSRILARKLRESNEISEEKSAAEIIENSPRFIPIAPRPSSSITKNLDVRSQGITKLANEKKDRKGAKRGRYKCGECGAPKTNHICKKILKYVYQKEKREKKLDKGIGTNDSTKKVSMEGALRILNVNYVPFPEKNDNASLSSSSSDAEVVKV